MRHRPARQHRLELDGLAQRAAQEVGDAADELVGIDRLGRQRLLARESQQPMRQRRRALGAVDRRIDRARARWSRRAPGARLSRLRAEMITASMLLKSCASPPVSWPIASIFWVWRSCASTPLALQRLLHQLGVGRLQLAVRGNAARASAAAPSPAQKPATPSSTRNDSTVLNCRRVLAVSTQRLVARAAAAPAAARISLDDGAYFVHEPLAAALLDRSERRPGACRRGAARWSASTRGTCRR